MKKGFWLFKKFGECKSLRLNNILKKEVQRRTPVAAMFHSLCVTVT